MACKTSRAVHSVGLLKPWITHRRSSFTPFFHFIEICLAFNPILQSSNMAARLPIQRYKLIPVTLIPPMT
jgi:hypothetical protein